MMCGPQLRSWPPPQRFTVCQSSRRENAPRRILTSYTSPRSPLSIISQICTKRGSKRRLWRMKRRFPDLMEAARSFTASSKSMHIGFSSSTCFPVFSAERAWA